jgi:hypothetical protein
MNEPRGNGRNTRSNSMDENRPSWRPSDQSMRDDSRMRDDDQNERWESQRGRDERWIERDRGDRQQGGYDQDYRHQGTGQYPYGGGSREWGAGHHQSYGDRGLGQRGQPPQGYGDRYGHEQDWQQQSQQTYRHGSGDQRWGQDRDQRYMTGGYGEDRYGRSNYMGGRWGENRGMSGMMGGRGYSGSDDSFDDRGYSQRMGFERNYEGNRMGSGMGMGSGGFGGGGMDVGRREGSFGSGQQGLGHRGKGPKNFTRSDEKIKERVSEALQDDDDIDASEIEVEVKSGEVILKGTVDDRRQKRMAEECIERIPGVTDIQNQLRVGNKWQVTSRGNQPGQGGVSNQDSDKKHRA